MRADLPQRCVPVQRQRPGLAELEVSQAVSLNTCDLLSLVRIGL